MNLRENEIRPVEESAAFTKSFTVMMTKLSNTFCHIGLSKLLPFAVPSDACILIMRVAQTEVEEILLGRISDNLDVNESPNFTDIGNQQLMSVISREIFNRGRFQRPSRLLFAVSESDAAVAAAAAASVSREKME